MSMKALRYLLIVAMTVIAISVNAQYRSQQPQVVFRSTSSGLVSSGSTLPQAAQTGVVFTGSTPYSKTTPYIPGRRKVGESGGWADEDDTEGEGDSGNPILPVEPSPIGDGTWILMVLAIGYAFFIAWRKKRVKSE